MKTKMWKLNIAMDHSWNSNDNPRPNKSAENYNKRDVIIPLCPSWCRFYPTHSARKLPSNNCTRRTWRPGWTGRVSRRSSLGWHNSSLRDSTNRNSNRKHIFGSSRDCPRPCSTTPSNSSRKSHSAPRGSPLQTPSNLIPCVKKKCIY